jgi:hypothetical protein
MIVIWAPDYTEAKGGHMALHLLCHVLRSAGHDAALYGTSHFCPRYLSAKARGVLSDDVVIYPERVTGNPLRARRYIQWRLYNAPIDHHAVATFDYAPMFGHRPRLCVIDPRLDLFRDIGAERDIRRAWTERKAGKQGVKVADRRGLEIPRGWSLEQLAETFQRTERFVSYDRASWLSVQAALCGAESIVAEPDPSWPWPGVGKRVDPAYLALQYAELQRDLAAEAVERLTPWL